MTFFYNSIVFFIVSIFFIPQVLNAQSLDEKLRHACIMGDYAKIEKAIKKNKVNLTGSAGNELMLIACTQGNVRMLDVLLEGGADVNSADPIGRTPMMAAVAYEHNEIVELLLNNGAKKGSAITQRDYDCIAHDRLEKGMTYRQVEKLIGSLGMSMVDVMEKHQFEVTISHEEKYRFVTGELSFWKHPCKTSKQQLGK